MERQTAEDDSGKTSFTDRDVEITQFYLYLTQIKKKHNLMLVLEVKIM